MSNEARRLNHAPLAHTTELHGAGPEAWPWALHQTGSGSTDPMLAVRTRVHQHEGRARQAGACPPHGCLKLPPGHLQKRMGELKPPRPAAAGWPRSFHPAWALAAELQLLELGPSAVIDSCYKCPPVDVGRNQGSEGSAAELGCKGHH